jgi:hypothetical protein
MTCWQKYSSKSRTSRTNKTSPSPSEKHVFGLRSLWATGAIGPIRTRNLLMIGGTIQRAIAGRPASHCPRPCRQAAREFQGATRHTHTRTLARARTHAHCHKSEPTSCCGYRDLLAMSTVIHGSKLSVAVWRPNGQKP